MDVRGSELDVSGLGPGDEGLPVIDGVQVRAGFVTAPLPVGHVVERLQHFAGEGHAEVGDGRPTLLDGDGLIRRKKARLLKRKLVGSDGNVVDLVDAVEEREVFELVSFGVERGVGDRRSGVAPQDAPADAPYRSAIGAERGRSETTRGIDPPAFRPSKRCRRDNQDHTEQRNTDEDRAAFHFGFLS